MSTPPGGSSLTKPSPSLSIPSARSRNSARLALLGIGSLHQARLFGIGHVLAPGRRDPHHRDEAVAVEVLGTVLVDPAVVVVVEGVGVGPQPGFEGREEAFGPVGIDPGEDVDGRGLEPLLDRGVAGRVLGQEFGHGQRELRAGQVVALETRGDEQGRTFPGRDDAGAGDLKRPDVAPAPGLADGRDPDQGLVRSGQGLDGLGQGGVIAIGGSLLGGRGGGRKDEEKGHEDRQDDRRPGDALGRRTHSDLLVGRSCRTAERSPGGDGLSGKRTRSGHSRI